jgi:hypothetical protein
MKRLPVLLLACCAAPRTRAEDAVKLSDLDWSKLMARSGVCRLTGIGESI